MIIIVSPSKTQKVSNRMRDHGVQPQLSEQAQTLITLLKSYDVEQIAEKLNVSETLAQLTFSRVAAFELPHTKDTAGVALCSFQGDVFSAIETDEYIVDDFLFAQKHLRILSGLYGILRPLDLMQPYRLEMGTKLKTAGGRNLYDFWGERITDLLNDELTKMNVPVVVDCASREYSRAVIAKKLSGKILTITFKQKKNGQVKTIAIYAKRARGMFVNHIIRNHITEAEQLKDFDAGGYRFSPEHSSDSDYLFVTDLT